MVRVANADVWPLGGVAREWHGIRSARGICNDPLEEDTVVAPLVRAILEKEGTVVEGVMKRFLYAAVAAG